MNLRFGDLEKLRVNPKAFYDAKPSFNKRSKFMRWQDAVGYYHKGHDISKVEKYLTTSFGKMTDNAANRKDLVKYIEHLHEYDTDYKKLKSEKIEYKKSLSFFVSAKDQIKGQIPRIDLNMDDEGYSAYFFCKENYDWESDLMFPVLQNCISNYFGCDSSFVKVGLYILNEGKHVNHSYNEKELSDADAELSNIIREIEGAV